MDLLDDLDRFSTLTPEQKHVLVTQLIERSRSYRVVPVICDRKEKRECVKWSSHLYKEELMMIGELDQEGVDDIISPSMERTLLMLDMDSDEEDEEDTLTQESLDRFIPSDEYEEEEEEEYYVPETFEDHLRDLNESMECLIVVPSSYNGEHFVDTMLNESAGDEIAKLFVWRGSTENLIGMDAEEYKKMMEGLRMRQNRRLVY